MLYKVTADSIGRRYTCKQCRSALTVNEDGLVLADDAAPPSVRTERPTAGGAPSRKMTRPRRRAEVAERTPARSTADANAPFDVIDLFAFRRYLSPTVIPIVYWLGLAGIVYLSIGMAQQLVSATDAIIFVIRLVAAVLGLRIGCEVILAVFRIHDRLERMNRSGAEEE
jgi:hypothetical protein